jgi:hypothetical protein
MNSHDFHIMRLYLVLTLIEGPNRRDTSDELSGYIEFLILQ